MAPLEHIISGVPLLHCGKLVSYLRLNDKTTFSATKTSNDRFAPPLGKLLRHSLFDKRVGALPAQPNSLK